MTESVKDIVTTVVLAIAGILIAFFLCNWLCPTLGLELTDYSYTVVDEVETNLSGVDNEVFNVEAVNPTIEVYVGDGTEE